MNHVDVAQHTTTANLNSSSGDPSRDGSVILSNMIVEVAILPHPDQLKRPSGSVRRPVVCVTGRDRSADCLATVNRNPLRPAVTPEHFAVQPLGSRQIATSAAPDFKGVAIAADGRVEIFPLTLDFDVVTPICDLPATARLFQTSDQLIGLFRGVQTSTLTSDLTSCAN
jgi:hypothetical protein